MGQTLAEKISSSRVMISGMKKDADKLAVRGVDEAYIIEYQELVNEVEELNNRQEVLKGELKSITALLNKKTDQMEKKRSNTTKLVKMTIDQSEWVEYGITATQ